MDVCIKLNNKSVESFLLAVEIYNKPTITYRVESFSYLICNAWELMLKSYMIKTFGYRSIYYKNSNRTISLERCIQKVFSNNKDPVRLNLEKIIQLRNTSTHFITEEYEMVYLPLFQACVFNYNDKIMKFHGIDTSMYVSKNFLSVVPSMKAFNELEIIAKYPEEISRKLIRTVNDINMLSDSNNHKFAINVMHHHYITKDEDKATSKIKIDNSSDNVVKVIKERVNPNNTHKYTAKGCIEEINKLLNKNNIILKLDNCEIKFNKYYFMLLIDYYGIKNNEKYCFIYNIHERPIYSYSYLVIEFLFDELKNDPDNIIFNIKKSIKKRVDSRSKGILKV